MVMSVEFNQISDAGLARVISISMAPVKVLSPGTRVRSAAYLVGRTSSGRRSLGASAANAESAQRANTARTENM
jgi:hypothetical protein